MHNEVVARLRCPVCAEPLGETAAGTGRCLRCARGHAFDLARQGYVQLTAGPVGHTGDTAAMVAARADFLAAGHYHPLSAALAAAAADGVAATAGGAAPLVVDVGAGTGQHLAAVLDAVPAAVGLALDAAKPAVRRAARAHPRADAAVCDTWSRLPLADASAAVLLDVFAPRNGPEFGRVLIPGGVLLVATPTGRHLAHLVEALGLLRVDPDKPDRIAAALSGHVRPDGERLVEYPMTLRHAEVRALVGMGPNAWHQDPAVLAARVAALAEPVRVTASVRLQRFRAPG